MKRTTLLITSVVLMVGCSKAIDEKNLVNRDGLKYEENKKTPFNGKTVSTYDNGQKELEGSYRDCEKYGQFTYWFKNGQKLKEGIYKDGKKDGKWIYWERNGQKKEEGTYKDGEREGLYSSWFEDGQKKEEGNYREGKKD